MRWERGPRRGDGDGGREGVGVEAVWDGAGGEEEEVWPVLWVEGV